jgi:multiple sugar transport system substrate-binding protein
MYMNQDALDKLGIAAPTTVEELETAMAAVKADGTYTPIAMSGVPSPEGAWLFFPLLLGEGVDYCNLDAPALQTGLERLKTWVDNGWLPRDAATWDQTDAWSAFFGGDYAFGLNGNWNLGDVRNNATFGITTTRYPAGSQGSHVFPGGEAIGIGGFSKNPDLAWDYIASTWLSKEAGLINFNASGQIPTRGDLAQDPAITGDALALPFVQAAAETGNWPLNAETATMQNAIGVAVSEIISGQTAPADAAAVAVDAINAAREAGGGSC